MIALNLDKDNSSGEKLKEPKINSKNIYSKIAPPNTFKRRNTNQMLKKPKIIQRYDNTPQTNQLNNLYLNNNSNRTSLKSNNNTLVLKPNSDIKLYQNVNSSFIEKIKIVKGSLFNNSSIISPKKIGIDTSKIRTNNNNNININNSNRVLDNKNIVLKNQIIKKHNSVYQKNNRMNHLIQKNDNTIIEKNNSKYDNIKDNLYIKNKYDFLLEKTRNLLFNYQKIVDYYQEKEKEKNKNNLEDGL